MPVQTYCLFNRVAVFELCFFNIFIRKNPRDIYFDVITPDRTNDIIDQVQGVFAQKVLSEIVQQFKN